METKKYDVIIIGRGPAGISAALYTVRANLSTLLIGKDIGLLKRVHKVDNYFGFLGGVSGEKLQRDSEYQVKELGGVVVEEEVISIEKNERFLVATNKSEYEAKSLILATGQETKKVTINGLKDYEGRGVSFCATCDGFFYKDLKVGVLGYKDFALKEALELKSITRDVTIFTNGNEIDISQSFRNKLDNFKIEKREINRLYGQENLEGIEFKDGSKITVDGIFVAYGSSSSLDFARKLGILTNNDSIITDALQKTNIEGLFAAGDCTGFFKQISVAVGQGAVAAKSAIEFVRSLN